jgi:MFS transporter, SP family, galactose:H+ symporter
MNSLNQIALTLGILIAYGVDYIYDNGGLWRAMFAWGLVPSAILLVGMLFMPDSSRWLLSKHREQQAHAVLQKVRGTTDVEDETQETTNEIKSEKGGGLAVLKTSPLRMPLIVGVGLAILQQATGINTVIYYAPTIFHAASFKSASSSIAATALIGAVNLVATIIAAFLVDRLGRRPLLLISLTGMGLGLVVLSMSFFLSHGTPTSFISLLTVTSLMIYISAFAIGIGPVFWLLISEIYPLNVRGTAMSLATVANWAANFLIAVTFLSFVNVLTEGGTFLLYAVVGVLAWIFAFRLVPETKGKTLEEIQQHWQADKHPREMSKATAPQSSS